MKKIAILPVVLCWMNSFAQGKFFGGNGDGFATAAAINVLLPLQVIHFSGEVNGNANVLLWSTASEPVTIYFEIERSTDAIHFEKRGQVAGIGGSGVKQYRFADSQLNARQYYYRLKQVEPGGQYYLSKTILLQHNAKVQQIKVVPNPVVHTAAVLINGPVADRHQLLLFNSHGVIINQFGFTGNNGTLNLSSRPCGLYFLQDMESGTVVKIIKAIQ